ncbi:MAG: glycosyltransferase [Saccharofermentans sp.]|nr:glycosyltransferase [Saccharofermentans sp.]
MNPIVSVCIPVYNNEETIKETIESVIAQTYRPIELVITNDASTDASQKAIEKALKEAGEGITLKVEINDTNLGMSGNWNKAMSLCTGKYIKLLCADDLIDKDLIKREAEILEANPDVLSVESDTAFVDSEGKVRGRYKRYKRSGIVSGKEVVKYSLFHRDYLGAPLANTFRADTKTRGEGFDPEFKYILDYEFFMRLAIEGDVYIIHEDLNFFRLRQGSNTSKIFKGEEGKKYINEHRMLAEKAAPKLGLTNKDVNRSVRIRKLMSFLGNIYLRLHM